MTRWMCPRCDREFALERQSHVCVPGITVDQVFEPWPPAYREIYDRLVGDLGPMHEDAVGVGVFLKNERKFAEVRPKARGLSLMLVLPRPISHPLISRRLPMSAGRTAYVFTLTTAEDVDEPILRWLEEAYDA